MPQDTEPDKKKPKSPEANLDQKSSETNKKEDQERHRRQLEVEMPVRRRGYWLMTTKVPVPPT